MARIDLKNKVVQAKLVYYGPGLCGKTTNLQYVNAKLAGSRELMSLATAGDRTIFFDFMPLGLGKLRGLDVEFKLYTVPGQVRYAQTRKMVLKNADGVVFVADSQDTMLDANLESLDDLFNNLKELGVDPDSVPLVLQYNKRDLKNILPVEELDAALNKKGCRVFPASAFTGEGVVETLKHACKEVLDKLSTSFPEVVPGSKHKPSQKHPEVGPGSKQAESQKHPEAAPETKRGPSPKQAAVAAAPKSETKPQQPEKPTKKTLSSHQGAGPSAALAQPARQAPPIDVQSPAPPAADLTPLVQDLQAVQEKLSTLESEVKAATSRIELELRNARKTSETATRADAGALASLQADLQTLRKSTAKLDEKLTKSPLEARLDAIESRLARLPTRDTILLLEKRLDDLATKKDLEKGGASGSPEFGSLAVREIQTQLEQIAKRDSGLQKGDLEAAISRLEKTIEKHSDLDDMASALAAAPSDDALKKLEERLYSRLPTAEMVQKLEQRLDALVSQSRDVATGGEGQDKHAELLARLEQRTARIAKKQTQAFATLEAIAQKLTSVLSKADAAAPEKPPAIEQDPEDAAPAPPPPKEAAPERPEPAALDKLAEEAAAKDADEKHAEEEAATKEAAEQAPAENSIPLATSAQITSTQAVTEQAPAEEEAGEKAAAEEEAGEKAAAEEEAGEEDPEKAAASSGTHEIEPKEDLSDHPDHINAARVARVMVADLYLYHRQEVEDGIRNDDFYERNKEALDDMRQTFESRVAADVRAHKDYMATAIDNFIERKRKQLG